MQAIYGDAALVHYALDVFALTLEEKMSLSTPTMSTLRRKFSFRLRGIGWRTVSGGL